MGLLSFLFGRTPRPSDPAPEFDVTVGNIRLNRETLAPDAYERIQRELAAHGRVDLTVTLPDEDVAEPAATPDGDAVEPVFCTIDYIDASDNRSRRRITTRAVHRWGNNSILAAYCHERKALRHFRVDRIQRVVTHDGEVFGALDFARDILALDLWDYSRPAPARKQTAKPERVNFSRYTSPAVLVLIAAAKADDQLHAEEVEQIHRYVEREATQLHRAGVIDSVPTIQQFDIIGRRIGRLRPTQDDIAEALEALRDRPSNQIDRLKHWLARVIAADGRVHLHEDNFMSDFDRFLALDDAGAAKELDELMLR